MLTGAVQYCGVSERIQKRTCLTVGGDPVGGDPVGGDPVGGDPVGGDPVGGYVEERQIRYAASPAPPAARR